MRRDYPSLNDRIKPQITREAAMRHFVDTCWPMLSASGVSWIGFYLRDGDGMILGPRRDKPACSPIGMHGACGAALRDRKPLVVRDVAELGENYIPCDPRDRSEIVIPLIDGEGHAWGVLDADSHEVDAFTDEDVNSLTLLLRAAGLTRD